MSCLFNTKNNVQNVSVKLNSIGLFADSFLDWV